MALDESSLKMVKVPLTPQGLGLVLNYVGSHEPFGDFKASTLLSVIKRQLKNRFNVALTDGQDLYGYLGWALCTRQSAEAWLKGQGSLKFLDDQPDAVAVLSVVVSDENAITRKLIRAARDLNKGRHVYFSRQPMGASGPEKRQKVLNFAGE